MSTETKRFTAAHILTVMHDRLMVPIGGVYEILDWLSGESLMTHQLPRVSREAEPFLREWFPDLAAVDVNAPRIESEADVTAWLASLGPEVAADRDVPRLPEGDHTRIDPLAELRMMRPDAPIIVISPSLEGGDR